MGLLESSEKHYMKAISNNNDFPFKEQEEEEKEGKGWGWVGWGALVVGGH